MSAKRWMFLGSLAAIGSVSCGDTPPPTDTAGAPNAGSAQAGTSGSSGSGTAGSTGGQGVGGSAGKGTSGSGGSTAGSAPTGGASNAGTGGTLPTSGSGGVGTSGTAGSLAGTGSGGTGSVSCNTVIASATLAPKIMTVGIIEWTTDMAGMTEARIEFGLTTSYGMTAPVKTTDGPSFRTLLLGMKQEREYHYRIVATGPGGDCVGADQVITTDLLPNGLPTINVQTQDAAALSGGFLITGQFAMSGGMAPAYIIDADGDYVWAYKINSDVTGVRPSFDAKHMWINAANVPDRASNVHRVSMDGETDEDLSDKFDGQNHQMTVLPDETVAFYAYGSSGCDDVKEYNPATGMVKVVANAQTAHGASGPCHLNAIEYSPEDDTYVFSDLDNNNITKVKRSDGSKVWVLGGETAEFTGAGSTWTTQHGIDVLGLNRILFFNNQGDGGGSTMIEMLLDLTAMTASRAWTYTANPIIRNQIMGDVQRLENGNTLAAYSTQGVVHEVGPTGTLLQSLTWATAGQFGYVQKRKSLYGDPPR